jgi:hypothetical protein
MSIDPQNDDSIAPESGVSEEMTTSSATDVATAADETVSLELMSEWNDILDGEVLDDIAVKSGRGRPLKNWWRDVPSAEALAKLAWRRATKGTALAKLIRRQDQFILVLLVPSEAWFKPIRGFLPARSRTRICDVKPQARSKSSGLDTDIDSALRNQQSVIVIGSDVRAIPLAVRSSADLTISVPVPDVALIRLLLSRTGRGSVPQNLDASTIAGLDFSDLCAIIRPGRHVKETINALTRASADRVLVPAEATAPPLETTRAFGAAGVWGAQLARDIADYRAGKISWAEVDRGAVIFGPPGTGKSLFARSLAQHCKVPIVVATVSDYFADSKGDLDSVVKAQREFFARAAIVKPSILFLDEIDAIPNRNTISNRGRDWWAPIINDFLTLLDSATSARAGIVVIGATNMIASIDPAILRPGRLERAIELGLPDAAALADILRHHLGNNLEGQDLLGFARRTEGATGAIAMEWVRSARRRARTENRPLRIADLEAAAANGPALSADELRRASIHETGHAIAILHYGGTVESIVLNLGGAVGGMVRESHSVTMHSSRRAWTWTKRVPAWWTCLWRRLRRSGSIGSASA